MEQFEFEGFGRRRVVAAFDAGATSSHGGGLLLRHTDGVIGLIERVAACFVDEREQDQVVHTLPTWVGQRIVGIALGRLEPKRPVDLVEEGVDLANRIGELQDSSLVARRLAPNRRVISRAPATWSAPAYRRRPGT